MFNSETLAEFERLVNFAIGKVAGQWRPTETELEDIRQDALIAAMQAYRRFDPTHGRKVANWILDRVIGQIKDSLQRLRSGGIVGGRPLVLSINEAALFREAVPSDGQQGRELSRSGGFGEDQTQQIEPIDSAPGPAEHAETERMMSTLGERLGTVDRRVLVLYYGLSGDQTLTVSQLAKQLGFSRKHTFDLLQRARNAARMALDIPPVVDDSE